MASCQGLAILSTGLYLPVEAYEVMRRVTWTRGTIFVLNALVLALMIYVRWHGDEPAAEPRLKERPALPGP